MSSPTAWFRVVCAALMVAFLMTATVQVAFAVGSTEEQRAYLRLSAEGASVTGPSEDAWLDEGEVVMISTTGVTTVTLTLLNQHSTKDSNDNVLVFVTNNPTPIISIIVDSNPVEIPFLTGSMQMYNGPNPFDDDGDGLLDEDPVNTVDDDGDGLTDEDGPGESLGVMPPHGIYGKGSNVWSEYRTGINLSPKANASVTFSITINNAPTDFRFHIDAYGWTDEASIAYVLVGEAADATFVPFSSDITFAVPEFGVSISIMASTAIIILVLARRFSTQGSLKVHKGS